MTRTRSLGSGTKSVIKGFQNAGMMGGMNRAQGKLLGPLCAA
jgi:hypothetical protein